MPNTISNGIKTKILVQSTEFNILQEVGDTNMEVFHKKVIFRGHVQGVGFRYQTVDVAKGYDVSGYVRNETDGSVTLEMEGEKEEIELFQKEVCEELQTYIKEFDEESEFRNAQFSGFRIA